MLPLKVGPLTISNRIIMPAITLFFTSNWVFNERIFSFYERRAKGKVGLIVIPMGVEKRGGTPYLPVVSLEENLIALRNFINRIRQVSDTKVGVQLLHLGRYASAIETGVTPIAPSPVYNPITRETPKEMDINDINSVLVAYREAARKLVNTGIDLLEIHIAGGYLLSSFLSPFTNRRKDNYGGPLENRIKYPLQVIEAVKEQIGERIALGIRVSGIDFLPQGTSLDEMAEFCRRALDYNIHYINVTGGWHESPIPQVTSHVPEGAFVYLAEYIKSKVGINVPVFASNRLTDPYLCDSLLRYKIVDAICWARPLIADPDLPIKIADGKLEECRWCIACGHCLDCIFKREPVSCSINPEMGKEYLKTELLQINSSGISKKRIIVIGGGIAGLTFALYAKQRGHEVEVYEKEALPGGLVTFFSQFPWKRTFYRYVEYLVQMLKNFGVSLKLKNEVQPHELKDKKVDVIVVATGGVPYIPEELQRTIPPNVEFLTPPHLAYGNYDLGNHVVIIGGGGSGCELALYLSTLVSLTDTVLGFVYKYAPHEQIVKDTMGLKKRNITILEKTNQLARDVERTVRWILLSELKRSGVSIILNAEIVNIEPHHIRYRLKNEPDTTHVLKELYFDTLILATGFAPQSERWITELKKLGIPFYFVGDARSPGKIINAVHSAFELASCI